MKRKKVKIIQLPNKILRQKSIDVPWPLNEEDEKLAQQMIDHIDYSQEEGQTMYRPGVGVAAVQYGILKNMFYVNVNNGKDDIIFKDVIINPKVLGTSESELALHHGEGCLSVGENWPNQEGFVRRKKVIKVEGYSYFDKVKKVWTVSDYVAIVFQHELDHLQGKLFIDRINKKAPWKKVDKLETI
ncbi:peptide deformylase [Mesomycoplasma lagogenitalium]|uniref:Peptide deformylase n=1 Tax=Mesomycoplasma lagogenitalium TaxID=171286 RepID=A0ABY8LVX6_9BACT|nr:peptide deformylase [Mesomycoplasma lagogenitalium]WGI36688.1 peptide deformylase [Mesomycoplasma lagogenitalium]